jgi:hypothetical protein
MLTVPPPLVANRAVLRAPGAAAWRRACAAALLLSSSIVWSSEGPAVLTMLEGEASLVIGARAFMAAPGARVPAGALIETGAKSGLLRLEWASGATLDLGPGTKVMLRPPLPGSTAGFYLLQGWAKHSQAAGGSGQVAAAFEVTPFKGVMVSQVDDAQAVLFSESGGGSFAARRSGLKSFALRPGESAVIAGSAPPQLLPRPAPAWLQQMPRAFRETLPSRAAQFESKPAPALAPRPALGYTALQPWLSAEPALRRSFPTRFAELLTDRSFKAAVNAGLKQHPEWEPLLRPPPPRPVAPAQKKPADPETPR